MMSKWECLAFGIALGGLLTGILAGTVILLARLLAP